MPIGVVGKKIFARECSESFLKIGIFLEMGVSLLSGKGLHFYAGLMMQDIFEVGPWTIV